MDVVVASMVLSWVVILLLCFAMSGLLAQIRNLSGQINSTTNIRAPHKLSTPIVERLNGEEWAGAFVAVFLKPGCVLCSRLTEKLRSTWVENPPALRTLLISESDQDLVALEHFPNVHTRMDGSLAGTLGIQSFPWLLAVSHDGVVLVNSAAGPSELEDAIDRAYEEVLR